MISELTTITEEQLKAQGIYCADDLTRQLLGHTGLSTEEFDIIHGVLPGLDKREIAIKIGGITYTMSHHGRHLYTVVTLKVADDIFSYPFLVTITQEREPSAPDDHNDHCPYACDLGEDWYVDGEEWDGEDECNCEWVSVTHHVATISNDEEWQAIGAYFAGLE